MTDITQSSAIIGEAILKLANDDAVENRIALLKAVYENQVIKGVDKILPDVLPGAAVGAEKFPELVFLETASPLDGWAAIAFTETQAFRKMSPHGAYYVFKGREVIDDVMKNDEYDGLVIHSAQGWSYLPKDFMFFSGIIG